MNKKTKSEVTFVRIYSTAFTTALFLNIDV